MSERPTPSQLLAALRMRQTQAQKQDMQLFNLLPTRDQLELLVRSIDSLSREVAQHRAMLAKLDEALTQQFAAINQVLTQYELRLRILEPESSDEAKNVHASGTSRPDGGEPDGAGLTEGHSDVHG